MVNFGPLAAEMDPVVWGIPANFHGFCVLAALLHGTPVVGVLFYYCLKRRGEKYDSGAKHASLLMFCYCSFLGR